MLFYLHMSNFCSTFAPAFEKKQGKMAEWSIASVLKTEVRKRTGGSNPSLSAKKKINLSVQIYLSKEIYFFSLNKMPAVACWDYKGIPLFPQRKK